ncbi:MAG: redoxin [Amycolatopsis sp.]|uniref:TlpA family protein disulfide reductase n=1 Tax=Amycolatopsis sp. TaxID=37632 RepID=UPI00260A08A9|nr:TlpA disulfide reductase family protein [Amycolatopsis sp.]MCU1684989.1 redoxin [Amycolatopsis sp.]
MTTVTKWAVAVAVLVLAAIVAFLPRGGDKSVKITADLGQARAKAALAACPRGTGEVKQLSGVSVPCLGDGSTVDVGTALAGRPTLVNVWATWCVPCKTELPVLAAYAAQPGAVGVLEVQVASSAADGLSLLTSLGVHLPSIFDGVDNTGPVRTALKVPPTLPASYLVTADGQVRFISNPRVFDNTDQVRTAVEVGLHG